MGYLATLLLLVGQYQIGKKRRAGFLLCLAGNVLWVAVGVSRETLDLILSSAVFAGLVTYNWFQWGADRGLGGDGGAAGRDGPGRP